MPFPDPHKQATHEAIKDPQVGDRFSEMYNFWVYVVYRDRDTVVTMEGSPPCEFPNNSAKTYTLDEFNKRFHYASPKLDNYWIRLVDRNNNVEGWYVPPVKDCPVNPKSFILGI